MCNEDNYDELVKRVDKLTKAVGSHGESLGEVAELVGAFSILVRWTKKVSAFLLACAAIGYSIKEFMSWRM